MTRAIEEAGVAIASFSGTVDGSRFVCYAEFDSVEDRSKAEAALKARNSHPSWAFWSRHTTAA